MNSHGRPALSGLYLPLEAHPSSKTTSYGWGTMPHTTHSTHPGCDRLPLFFTNLPTPPIGHFLPRQWLFRLQFFMPRPNDANDERQCASAPCHHVPGTIPPFLCVLYAESQYNHVSVPFFPLFGMPRQFPFRLRFFYRDTE